MATTFKGLAEMADWKPVANASKPLVATREPEAVAPAAAEDHDPGRLVLHHDVHIHLPPTSDVSVYTAIFRALRAELLD
jgi:hypothetical protein